MNYKQSHPNKKAKSIDYGIVMVMLPMVLLGSIIGVMINTILPELVLLIGLTLLLIFLAVKSIMTSIKIRRKENRERQTDTEENEDERQQNSNQSEVSDQNDGGEEEEEKNEEQDDESHMVDNRNDEEVENRSNFNNPSDNNQHPQKSSNTTTNQYSKNSEQSEVSGVKDKVKKVLKKHDNINRIKRHENTHCKPASLVLIPLLFFILITLSLFRGNSDMDSIIGVESCSGVYFFIFALLIVMMILITFINIFIVKFEYKVKLEHKYNFVEGDLKWETSLLIKFIIWAFVAGLVSGTVGLGGGVIFNPLLQGFKVPPIVASATGMYMVMFSTLSSSILFIFAGYMDIAYAFWLSAYVFIGTVIGVLLVNRFIKKTGRQSYLAFLLSGVIILCAIVIPVYSVLTIILGVEDDNIFSFKSIC